MALHLTYNDIAHVIDDDISTDEKFYEVLTSNNNNTNYNSNNSNDNNNKF